MAVYESAQELIGRTPLVRLAYSGFPEDVKVYAKLELWNPSGSVKDRTGLYMVRDAEKRGLLKPGGVMLCETDRSDLDLTAQEGVASVKLYKYGKTFVYMVRT